MKLLYIGVLMIFLPSVFLFADNDTREPQKQKTDANITGHVVKAGTDEHLPFITITLKGTTIGVATDATGHYFLKNLPQGEFSITASGLGYRTDEQIISTISGKTIEVNFDLVEEAVMMDEVVVTASRNETNKRSSATIVNISSAKLFENVASTNLAESMNFQPGVRIENNCGNCGTAQLRINGLEGQYSQILLDSRPIFSSLAGVYGLEQLPVSMIERVEVVRGGGSALFGSSAIGGVVNIITKEPLRNSASLANTTNILPDGRTDVNTSLNGSFVSDDHRAGVYLFGMVKNRQWYDHNDDGFSDIPEISSETAGFRGYYRTSLYSRITAEYHHINEFRRGGNAFDLPAHEADVTEQLDHKIDGGGLRFDINTPDYNNRFSVFTSMQNIKRESYYGAEKNSNAYGNTKDITFVGGAQYTHSFDKLWFMPAELTGGIEYTYNNLDDHILGVDRILEQTTHVVGGFFQNEWKTKKFSILGVDRILEQTTHVVGGFFQNEWKTKKFSFLLGARLDKHNLMDNVVFNPRANMRYSPSDKIGFRASYSSGYRAPQAYNEDLHVEAVGGALAIIQLADNLKPEYSHSLSASADFYHNFGSVQTNFLVEGFYTILNDVFKLEEVGNDPDGNRILERLNASGATVKGLNLEAKLGLSGVFEIQLGYTFQKSRYKEAEKWSDDLAPQKKMFRAPDNYGYITSSVNLTRDFKASVFANYTGSMLVKHVLPTTNLEKITSDFMDVGTKLSYNFRLTSNLNFEINGGVKNIFNSYQKDLDKGALKDSGYVYGPTYPRMVFFGAKIEL